MKYFLVFLFSMISILAMGQIEDTTAKRHFNDGLAKYNSGFYQLADSLFSLSFKIEPSLNAFYYKTLSGIDHEEICTKCEKWKLKSYNKFIKHCHIVEAIIYPEYSTSEWISYCRLSMNIGDSAEKVRYGYCRKYYEDNSVSEFYIEPDSLNNEITNPVAHFPDLGKISPDRVVYIITNEMPRYQGGDEARIKFLSDNIIYPVEAKENGISGIVYLSFFIDQQGYIKDVEVIKGAADILDAEALRVTSLMPQWIPGKDNGQPVQFKFYMPIKFTLN